MMLMLLLLILVSLLDDPARLLVLLLDSLLRIDVVTQASSLASAAPVTAAAAASPPSTVMLVLDASSMGHAFDFHLLEILFFSHCFIVTVAVLFFAVLSIHLALRVTGVKEVSGPALPFRPLHLLLFDLLAFQVIARVLVQPLGPGVRVFLLLLQLLFPLLLLLLLKLLLQQRQPQDPPSSSAVRYLRRFPLLLLLLLQQLFLTRSEGVRTSCTRVLASSGAAHPLAARV